MFVGDWNDYHDNYKWHKLRGGDHSALGDCLATLELIRQMASARKAKRWYEFWVVGQ
jgi:DNA polymerase-3 subunit epsilon